MRVLIRGPGCRILTRESSTRTCSKSTSSFRRTGLAAWRHASGGAYDRGRSSFPGGPRFRCAHMTRFGPDAEDCRATGAVAHTDTFDLRPW